MTRSHVIRNDSTLTQEQKAEKIRSIHQSTRQQVSGILTPEQREKMREHRTHRGEGEVGPRGGRRGRLLDRAATSRKSWDRTHLACQNVFCVLLLRSPFLKRSFRKRTCPPAAPGAQVPYLNGN